MSGLSDSAGWASVSSRATASSAACPAHSAAGRRCATSSPRPGRAFVPGGAHGSSPWQSERRRSMTKEWSRPATARDAILQRIRAALDDVTPETSRLTLPPLPRAYRKADDALRGDALIAQFIERVGEYKASVRETTAPELPEAIAAALSRQGVRKLAVPADLPADWPPSGVTLLRDEPPPANEALDSSDGVLTACALGIAQTGTIVLDAGLRPVRQALSLIPDYHLCVVHADQIVGIVP